MTNNNSQKGFAVSVMITLVAVVLVFGGVVYYAGRSETQENKMMQEKAMMEKETMEQKEKDAMMEKGETMMKYSGAMLAGKSAPLLDFVKADYDAAIKTDTLVVLYFYANWCSICKAEFPITQEAFNELRTDKVIGFRVNYNDDQTDNDEKNLAREFGVAYQHTKVFVKNGKRILKSPEGWDDKRYDMEISKALGQ